MATVTVRLPSLLTSLLKLPRSIEVSGSTLDDALEALCRGRPGLAVHLFDESGQFRRHVLCFVNESSSRETAALEYRLRDGDTITILQAVSGG